MGQAAWASNRCGLCPAELRARGSLPVRLEPRSRPAERRDGNREGRSRPALPQPHVVRARLRRKLASADDGNGQMVNILTAVLTDGLPAVEAACAEAITQGVHSADVIL